MDVFSALRTDIDVAYPAWTGGARPTHTRAGARYPAADVARLVAAPLRRAGLAVYFAPDRGDEGEELFVTAAGRHVSRRRLGEILGRALMDHPDPVLRESVRSPAVLRELLPLLPTVDAAPTTRDRAPAAPRGEVPAATREHFARFVAEHLQPEEFTSATFRRYTEDADAEGVLPLGRNAFHREIRSSGAVTCVHTRRGNIYRKV